MVTSEKALSRRAHLEALFQKYPDANREVIFKEDVLREGYSFTEAALRVAEKHRQPFYNVYIYDRVSKDQFRHNEPLRAPEYIHLHGGLYDLRGSLNIGHILVPDSPYVVDVVDGMLQLCEREGDRMIPLAELKEYGPVPEYWSRRFENGELMCHQAGPGWVTAFNNCQYSGPKEECIFCNINTSAREARERGEVGRLPYKDPHKVGLALEEQYRRCQWPPGQRPDWVRITGGQITGKLAGKEEIDFYLQYVDAIVERIGQVWPINLAMTPQPRDCARRLREHGVHTRSINFEGWDRELFRFVCRGHRGDETLGLRHYRGGAEIHPRGPGILHVARRSAAAGQPAHRAGHRPEPSGRPRCLSSGGLLYSARHPVVRTLAEVPARLCRWEGPFRARAQPVRLQRRRGHGSLVRYTFSTPAVPQGP
ncbi:MAG: hypothetical protein ACE5JU_07365 [Candidatus Binatia bacterium]